MYHNNALQHSQSQTREEKDAHHSSYRFIMLQMWKYVRLKAICFIWRVAALSFKTQIM